MFSCSRACVDGDSFILGRPSPQEHLQHTESSLIYLFIFIYIDLSSDARRGDDMLSRRGRRLKNKPREVKCKRIWLRSGLGRKTYRSPARSPIFLPSRRLVCLFWLFSFLPARQRSDSRSAPEGRRKSPRPTTPPRPASSPPSVSINISFPGWHFVRYLGGAISFAELTSGYVAKSSFDVARWGRQRKSTL